MKSLLRTPLAVAAVLAGSAALFAEETMYHFGHSEKFVNIQFQSDTELETIVGTTNKASGSVSMDLEKGEGFVSISVPVLTMTTGIEMRDEHMRSANWLDAANFPEIAFRSTKVKIDRDKGTAQVTGDFSMHGKTKEMTVTATFKAIPKEASEKAKFPAGDWVRFTTEFEVKLSDFGVDVAKAGGKVSDTWKIRMTLFGCTSRVEAK